MIVSKTKCPPLNVMPQNIGHSLQTTANAAKRSFTKLCRGQSVTRTRDAGVPLRLNISITPTSISVESEKEKSNTFRIG